MFVAGAIKGTISLGLEAWKTQVEKVRKDTYSMNEQLRGLQGKAEHAGKSLLSMTTVLSAVGVASVKASLDFNRILGSIESLGISTPRVLALKTEIQDLAIATGKSVADIGNATQTFLSTFEDTADTMKIVDISARAAAAGGATTQETFKLLAAMMKGFNNVSAEAAQKTADLAFQTVKLGQATLPEMAASMGSLIPMTVALGVKEEELFAIMTTLVGVTGSTAEVSTQLSSVMTALAKMTPEASAAMDKLGFNSAEAMVKQLGLTGAIQAMIGTTDGSAKSVNELFARINAVIPALALSGSSANNFAANLEKVSAYAGSSKDSFDRMTQGTNLAGFTFDQLKVRVSVAAQTLGDALLPALRSIMDVMGAVLTPLTAVIAGLSTLPRWLTTTLVGATALVATWPRLVSLWDRSKNVLSSLGNTNVLGKLTGGLAAATVAAAALQAGFDALKRAQDRALGQAVSNMRESANLQKEWNEYVKSGAVDIAAAQQKEMEIRRQITAEYEKTRQSVDGFTGAIIQEALTAEDTMKIRLETFRRLRTEHSGFSQYVETRNKELADKQKQESAEEIARKIEIGNEEKKIIADREKLLEAATEKIKSLSLSEVEFAEWKLTRDHEAMKKTEAYLLASLSERKTIEQAYYAELDKIRTTDTEAARKKSEEKLQKEKEDTEALLNLQWQRQEESRILMQDFALYEEEQRILRLEAQGLDDEAARARLAQKLQAEKQALVEKYGFTSFTLAAMVQAEMTYDEQVKAIEVARKAREEKDRQERKQKNIQVLTSILNATTQMIAQIGSMTQQSYQNKIQMLDDEYQKEKDRITATVADETERERLLAELEKKHEEKKMDLRKKAAAAEKKAAIFSAVINTAAAIVAALSMKPFFPMGLVAAATAGVMGAVQIAAISSKPVPFADGGIVMPTPGGTIAQIGENREPEAVIPLSKFGEVFGEQGGSGLTVHNHWNLQFIDGRGLEELITRKIGPMLTELYRKEVLQIPAKAISGAY